MQFLAHRGWWKNPAEKNRPTALQRALQSGFGLETDFRDRDGTLVVAHDPATAGALVAETVFAFYAQVSSNAPLALNIKADGLRTLLKPILERHLVSNYFCFDMSVPETLNYRREGLRYFTRESEYEPHPPLYEDSAGVWMDMFHTDWIAPEHIIRHLEAGKQVALVSPELHRRPHENYWLRLRDAGLAEQPRLMLCTDLPEAAREFFI